jgi:hypothetical protein
MRLDRAAALASMTVAAILIGVGAAAGQVKANLTKVDPSSGQPVITTVRLDGNKFPSGPIPAANVFVTLTPDVAGTGPTATTVASDVTVDRSGRGSIRFIVPAILVVAAPTRYAVSATGTSAAAVRFTTDAVRFTVNPAAQLVSVTPASGNAGTSLTVTLQAAYTDFKAGSTQASFGAGISVGGSASGGFGPVTVLSRTSATASLTIAANAVAGTRNVTVRTGTQEATKAGAFAVVVVAPRPTITASTAPPPNSAGWNTTDVSVTFTCTNATTCGPDQVVTSEGAAQVISGTASGAGGTATTSVNVSIDKTPAALLITSPTDGTTTVGSTILVSGTVADALSGVAGVRCGPDPVVVAGGTWSCTVALQPGDNAISVHADDVAGNGADRTIHVTRGSSPPPRVTITDPAPGTLFSRGPITVSGTVDDPAAAVVVDGITATLVNGSFSATAVTLREGLNIVTATATALTGAVGSASTSVLLDTTAPRLLIQSPADGSVLSVAQVPVAGMVNDIVSGTVNAEQVTVIVNGIDAAISNRSFFVPEVLLVRGENTIRAVARDRAGNEQAAEIHVTLRDSAGSQAIARVSGDGQTAVVGALLADPLVARLVDSDGRPVAGRPVTFTVTRSDGVVSTLGAEGQQLSAVSDASGLAVLQFRVGSRVGAGINEVVATSPGFAGQAVFCATSTAAPPAAIKGAGVMGESHRGVAEQPLPLPLEAVVFDARGNPVPDVPVTFSVVGGGGTIDGLTEVVRPTNSDGRVSATLVLGAKVTPNANVVRASFAGQSGPPVTFTATGYLPGPAAATRVSGIVLDNTDHPVPGATAKIVGTPLTAVSDSVGRFTIDNAPVGTLTLIVDGSTSTRPERFPFLAFMILAVPGQDNTIGMPIYLPPLDASNSKVVGGDDTAVLTMKDVPGVAFTVFPHSATFPDGSRIGRLSLSQVHADKVPMPPPNGSTPRVVWTLQPAGVKFDPPIQVQLPNTDGYQPGQVVEVFQFDHDLEQFVSVGPARVSADGSFLVTDPGFGTTKAGWGAPQPPPPPPNTDVGSCTPAGGGSSGAGSAAGGSGPFSFAASGAADMCTVPGLQDGQCVDVPVTVGAPTPRIDGAPGGVGPNQLVDVNVPVSFGMSPGGNCPSASIAWDFGDGGGGTGSSPSHTYTQAGRYTVVVHVSCDSCSSATASSSVEVIVKPAVTITRVISDQIPGAVANFIPGGTGASTAPDDQYIMVGARSDNVLYLVAELSPISATGGLQLAAAIRKSGEAQVQCIAFNSATTRVQLQRAVSGSFVDDHEVVVGVDADNDGFLSTDEVIAVQGGIKGVGQGAYVAARLEQAAINVASVAFLPQANGLLATFLGTRTEPNDPPYVTATDETITFNDPDHHLLTHNTGLQWNVSGMAGIKRYTWRADSPFALDVRDDSIVRRSIYHLINDRLQGSTTAISDQIVQYFIDHPGESAHDFPNQIVSPFANGTYLTFRYDNLLRLNNALALGGVRFIGSISLKAVRFGGLLPNPAVPSVVVSELTFNGHIEDLYDFQYRLGGINTTAAILQAGWPTLGDSGRIFFTQVDMAGASVLPLSSPPILDLCLDAVFGTYKPICNPFLIP